VSASSETPGLTSIDAQLVGLSEPLYTCVTG
jgi:hypothetical protein